MCQGKKHREEIQKANSFMKDKAEEINKSKYKPLYHFSSPVGWINDPNGFSFFNEEYHLFYQFYPYEPNWGPMHWGHAKSKDLIHWEHAPVALAPSEEYDYSNVTRGHGCFSGSAIEHNGKLYLIYTGSVGEEGIQTQNVAISGDGIIFKKSKLNPVIDAIPEKASKDFRDPKVWKHKDKYYLVIGTKKDGKGKIALYSSVDLLKWDFMAISLESEEGQGDMWECPDLFHVDNTDVLIVSPMIGRINCRPIYIQGTLNYETGEFNPEDYATLDYGYDFYAPQTMIDKQGRRILIAWMEQWNSIMPTKKDGWSGIMTFPRELRFKDGKLLQMPIDELKNIRTREEQYTNLKINSSNSFIKPLSIATDIVIEIDVTKVRIEKFHIYLKSSEDKTQSTKVIFDLKHRKVIMDRKNSGEGEDTLSEAPINLEGGILDIRILLDRNSCELFINHGQSVVSNRIYPDANSNYFIVESDKEFFIDKINIYDLAMSKSN